ncbi:hypothetical protein DFH09DRAFT_1289167 [Mycena vulgaris]|nr:hypothetical protein DFH09DRAFT_1289167 [Mycena vulgaris]
MAFNFLNSDFFNVQNDRSLPTPPATPVLPSNAPSLPLAAVPETRSFTSHISPNVTPTTLSSFPGVPPPASTLSMDTPARYVPRAFTYNTPVNNNTFGTVNDSGYRSLSSRTSSYHLPPTPAPHLPDKSPCDTYVELYQAGDLRVRGGSGNTWDLQCLTCDAWVRTPVPTRRLLSIPNHFANLESHCSSSKCVARSVRASCALPILTPRKSASSSTSSATPQAEDEDDDESDDFEFQHGRSSSLPPEALPHSRPTPSPMIIVQTCPGSHLNWPDDAGSFTETFPFHRIGVHPGSLSFSVEIHERGTKVVGFSKECSQEARLDSCCAHCAKNPAEVQRLADLAVQADSRVNHCFLNWSQIRALLADRTEEVCKWRLKSLNSARNFATAVRKSVYAGWTEARQYSPGLCLAGLADGNLAKYTTIR